MLRKSCGNIVKQALRRRRIRIALAFSNIKYKLQICRKTKYKGWSLHTWFTLEFHCSRRDVRALGFVRGMALLERHCLPAGVYIYTIVAEYSVMCHWKNNPHSHASAMRTSTLNCGSEHVPPASHVRSGLLACSGGQLQPPPSYPVISADDIHRVGGMTGTHFLNGTTQRVSGLVMQLLHVVIPLCTTYLPT